ncbi:MAG: T9SS type A sorting domain-containing protein [Bacteroidales bacterium]|nr:T9SS type A sorting domain-containing protein [Bacteroidales bacterium]
MLQERWTPGTWKNDLKSDYAYESNMLTVITQYSDDGLNWLNGSRFIYTYNENGYYDELLIHSWDENQWVAANKVDYTVDDGGNILTEWAYNPSGIGWVSDSRKTYTHDTFGNTLTGKNEIWSSGTWQPDMQTSYLYYKNEYVLLLNVQTYRFEASYKGFPLGYDNKTAFNFKLFPNPADNIVRIDGLMVIPEGNVISVSDMHGRILKKVDLKTGDTIVELGDIISGHYLFTIESKSGMRSGKLLIIQH